MEEMTIWEQHTIMLIKDPKMGFGFALSGGRDKPHPETGDTAVIVSDVVRNGPAMGRLQTQDQIVMVNGVSMENVSSNYTIQHLKSCGKTANITVKRPRVIQIPASTRPVRAASHSNLLDDPPHRRNRRGSGSPHGYGRRARSATPDRNGHDLPLMSGFKRLPSQDVLERPIRATLVKKKATDEYGMKLGSQIFIKHMTPTGLASKEGSLQEGDLVLKINGMVTENLSLLETKHLVEKSRGKLTMLVLRDDRKFLVSIPEVEDSPRNSEGDQGNSSSELEDISDLDSDSPARNRTSRPPGRERRTRRTRAEAPPVAKSRDSSPVRSTLSRPIAYAAPPRRVPSDSDSDRSPSPPPPARDGPDNRDKYRMLSGISTLPNPRASPITQNWNAPRPSSGASRPRKAVSESDSDRSASPPRRRESPRADDHSRYRVLPDLPPPGLRASPLHHDYPRRGSSPYRPPPPDDSESESDGSDRAPRRMGTPVSQDSRNRYRATPEVISAPAIQPPNWSAPKTSSLNRRGPTESESEASSGNSRTRSGSAFRTRATPVRLDSPRRSPSPTRPPEDSSESERAPSPPVRQDSSTDQDSHRSFPRAANGNTRIGTYKSSSSKINAKPIEEPLYSLPPDAIPVPNPGYSSDQNRVEFVKEGSVGLRLVGGNDVGIFVGGVQPNSPAQKQGIKEGDQILQVNGVDFGHFTREEAAMFLLNIRTGEKLDIRTQNKIDIYKKILKSSLGDSFYIRTHFDHEAEGTLGLSFTRGEVFRILDTMHRGKLGNWLAVRMGNDLHEMDKGTIPNQARAETLASLERSQKASGGERQGPGPRAEFWKLRGLRGAKKNVRRTRDDLLQLTIQGKFPAYEKVLLREANFKRPIVILGPLNDIAMEKLSREMPNEFEIAEMVPRGGGDGSSTVIKLDTVRKIAEQDKHPLVDITPTAIERLNYIQYHPMTLFLDPQSRKDVKTMRQRYSPNSNKSSRRLYTQALKMRKHYSHLFSARIDLQPNSNIWYEILKDKIRQQQSKPVWVSEVMLEGGGEEELDVLSRSHSTDYLSCDSRAASDYEDTDGEPFTDGEVYTDNEDLDDAFQDQPAGLHRHQSKALARSSEPALDQNLSPEPPAYLEEEEHEYSLPPPEIPPILHVPEPRFSLRSNSPLQQEDARNFSDSDFSASEPRAPTTPSDGPPEFRAPDPIPHNSAMPDPPSMNTTLESTSHASLSAIEDKLQETRLAEPQEKRHSPLIVMAHHEAVQWRRTQIRGSDSSEDEDEEEEEEDDDIEWGPATEL
ncbi:tight junction protein ZO-3 [Chanos chanos]|uniref:Tight junction protein ZO-3 n=1 Tax=Chanos chanos TaxID=29144 RepID=A0A6J2W3X7_CHACN|nr:tight junction protein ZO-3-like [Chanos chanos]